MKVTVSILAFSSSEGEELESMLKAFIPQKLTSLGFECLLHDTIWNGTQYDTMKASFEDDIVIFDASIEYHNGTWDSNYAAATANAMAMDNILVVSRTRLPFNYQAMRTNVPELGQEKRDIYGNVATAFTNQEIVEWLGQELDIMSKRVEVSKNNGTRIVLKPRIPVPTDLKTVIPPFDKLQSLSADFYKLMNVKMLDAIDYMKQVRTGGAFISYRSHYYKNAYHGISACDLKNIIKKRHNDDNYPVTLYAEGDIAFEFMTEQRRWGVESYVDKKIRSVDEFWIFETDNEDGYGYFDSWWTCGEIISLMYIKACAFTLPRIFVCKYDQEKGKMTIEEKDRDYIPDLSQPLLKELARYFANADGANESMENMRALREKNLMSQRFAYYAIKQLQKKVLPSDMVEAGKDGNQFSDFKASIHSHVYDKSFTNNHIVFCHPARKNPFPRCIADFKEPQFIWNFIRTNSDIDEGKHKEEIESRGFFSVSPTEMNEIVAQKQWVCKANGEIIKITEAPESMFQWWPIRMGKRTGPDECIIEKETNWLFNK